MTKNRDRARGTLYGQAVGDALGTTLEFQHRPALVWDSWDQVPFRPIEGKGPFHLEPGQVTDDTQLAVALAQSLMEQGTFDEADVMRRYAAWRHGAFDIGGQTSSAIRVYEESLHKPREAAPLCTPSEAAHLGGRLAWKFGRSSAGNGSLMRTSPIGVRYAGQPSSLLRAVSRADSALTHADPRCMMACAAHNSAIAHAIQDLRATPTTMLIAVSYAVALSRDEMLQTQDIFHRHEIEDAAAALDHDLVCAQEEDPLLYGGPAGSLHMLNSQGFVRVAFRLAFWELMHAPTFEAGLIDCVDRGGDADTNGAIAGSLLGSYFGESKIPKEWQDSVLNALAGNPDSRWWREYHPRMMLEMVP